MRIERIWRFLRSYNERKRKSCQAADVDQKRVKSTKERIINLPVMVRQWFPHTDERHERHDGEVIERVSIHIKIQVRNCRKQEENEIFMRQEKNINLLHQRKIQK